MKYLWVDMEMSGLDVSRCRILEVAAIVTDSELRPLETYEAIVHQSQTVLDAMDEWCQENHGKSGLTALVPNGKPESVVEQELLGLVNRHFKEKERPILCGNSIGQDRKFIDAYMPSLSQRLHYRMLDVTSFKIVLGPRFGIEFQKKGSHRALGDILESIAELNHYLGFVRRPNPSGVEAK
jgi:oligoribonuclease